MSGCFKGFKRRRGGKNLLKDEIIIYTGSFGSGKTEIAINQSIEALKKKEKVVIVDLDIVNPYFRSRDM
ncbi:MAG TPA: PhoH family protein, partial [Atribacterota bacterium]|nr:PhoH family protein [Atribacterota bacterium]